MQFSGLIKANFYLTSPEFPIKNTQTNFIVKTCLRTLKLIHTAQKKEPGSQYFIIASCKEDGNSTNDDMFNCCQ